MKKNTVKQLVFAAVCLAIGLILPSVFHTLAIPGTIFLPMHIPVLLCGLLCGWQLGGFIGVIVPLLCSALTGMPPIFPTGVAMVFELCAYGLLGGLFYRKLKWNVYLALIGGMVCGRLVSGVANAVFMGMADKAYGLQAFVSGAFVTALPGIAIQIVLIPLIVLALEKSKLSERP